MEKLAKKSSDESVVEEISIDAEGKPTTPAKAVSVMARILNMNIAFYYDKTNITKDVFCLKWRNLSYFLKNRLERIDNIEKSLILPSPLPGFPLAFSNIDMKMRQSRSELSNCSNHT
jgi:hypothetical protein